MSTNPSFPENHIDFYPYDNDLTPEQKHTKALTIIGASAISLLCYQEEDDVAKTLREDDLFRFVREQDIISGAWSLTDVGSIRQTEPKKIGHAAPLLAWSTRLQVLFLGFRGTQAMADILTNIDVRQTAEPDLASRFHAGFSMRAAAYTTLIEQLSKKQKVVVCGHSLGGALATIAAYQVLARRYGLNQTNNIWEEGSLSLSVITFGSPSTMVVESQDTTAMLQHELGKNFHHIINPQDYIPFILNNAMDQVNTSWKSVAEMFKKANPILHNVLQPLGTFLKYWASCGGQFAHFGCVYLLEARRNDGVHCRQITEVSQIPKNPGIDGIKRFHAMSHYAHCVSRAPEVQRGFQNIDMTTSITSEQFWSNILPLPGAIQSCVAVVSDTKVLITIIINERLAQFLVKEFVFKQRGNNVQVTKAELTIKTDNHEQIQISIQHDFGATLDPEAANATVNALQRSLTLHDSFGRYSLVPVDQMRCVSLRSASLPSTFESIRLAMTIAFAEQTAKVQELKLNQSESNASSLLAAGVLAEKAELIAGIIDGIVSSACPHLIVAQLQTALKLVQALWPIYYSSSGQDQSLKTRQLVISGETPKVHEVENLRDLIPQNCPEELRGLLYQMLDALQTKGIKGSRLSVGDWVRRGHPTLKDLFPQATSFAGILKEFGQMLYERPTEPTESQKRIELAIQQSDKVMTAIRFSHLVILTQLDAPSGWYCTSEEVSPLVSVVAGLTPSYFSATAMWSWLTATSTFEGFVGVGLMTASGLAVAVAAIAVFAVASTTVFVLSAREKELLHSGFDRALQMSMQALCLSSSSPDDIKETPITNHLKDEMHSAEDPVTLEKWQNLLKKGLENQPKIVGTLVVTPTRFWAKWLFDVARVGHLRNVLSSKTRLGVEGPTEAGKSELLTTLIGAPERVFCSGSSENSRTMEIQLYEPAEKNFVFMDCPGSDDKNPRIREMAQMFREMFGVVIFVVPAESTRSQATTIALTEVATFLRYRKDYRPVRVLLSKVDRLDHHRRRDEVFRNAVQESKNTIIREIKKLGHLDDDFTIQSRQAYSNLILLATESLDDIVKPYSTHAQMSLDGKRALSDCPEDTDRKIDGIEHFQNLHKMAENDELWDVESLRQWLRRLSPNSVLDSNGRVWQDK